MNRALSSAYMLGSFLFLGACGNDHAPELESPSGSSPYYPARGDGWERKAPEDVGMNRERLDEAVAFAEAHETSMPKDPGRYLRERFAGQADQEIVGPTQKRGGVNGIVVRHGYIVAEWGDTRRTDMTFSVTKSYLSTLGGIAIDQGLIESLNDRVSSYVDVDGVDYFDSAHNSTITWKHLFTQTSEWEGTLWGKPDTADRRRGIDRALSPPGTFWEYNDVRVNLLAACLLHVYRRPLPDVLAEEVMDPIGASDTWRWHGYRTSFTEIDGTEMQSVSGGGHWGGGLFISTRDHARFGYLFLRRGRWKDRQIVSESWVDAATTPSEVEPSYGFMWWLNRNRERFPSATSSSFFALGAGSTSTIVVDPDHDLVIVSRWVEGEQVDGVIARVLAAIE
ncbi:MAG TPA: serine hydrolase [Vicinamibacteria bacterium]|nr:serine hydrolase [Vicinamibacteria bacterium]